MPSAPRASRRSASRTQALSTVEGGVAYSSDRSPKTAKSTLSVQGGEEVTPAEAGSYDAVFSFGGAWRLALLQTSNGFYSIA